MIIGCSFLTVKQRQTPIDDSVDEVYVSVQKLSGFLSDAVNSTINCTIMNNFIGVCSKNLKKTSHTAIELCMSGLFMQISQNSLILQKSGACRKGCGAERHSEQLLIILGNN